MVIKVSKYSLAQLIKDVEGQRQHILPFDLLVRLRPCQMIFKIF